MRDLTGGIQFDYKKESLCILAIVVIILIGYNNVFSGGNFFTYEDPVTISGHTYLHKDGNGWRSDKGLGISYFFGDPITHPWSLVALWDRLMPSREFSYNLIVMILGTLSAITLYLFLRIVMPELGYIVCLISPLIVFSPVQLVFQYLRHCIPSTIAIPLFFLLLYRYYKAPKIIHLFLAALLFSFVTFFGALFTLGQLLSAGFFFSILYCLHFKMRPGKFARLFILLYASGLIMTFFLGFWQYYSSIVEVRNVEYYREKVFLLTKQAWSLPRLNDIWTLAVSLLGVEFIPTNLSLPGLPWRPFPHIYNVSIIFPLIFIFFLFRRPENFWEYAFKWLVIIYLLNMTLRSLCPLVNNIERYVLAKSYTLIAMPSFESGCFILQTGLIGLFLLKMRRRQTEIKNRWGKRIQSILAVFLLCILGITAIAMVLALTSPDVIPKFASELIQKWPHQNIGSYTKSFLSYAAAFNIKRLEGSVHWYSLLYCLITISLIILMWNAKRWKGKGSSLISIFSFMLVLSALCYSWTIYPLNHKKLLFQEKGDIIKRLGIRRTDRFYRVGIWYKDLPGARSAEVFERNWVNVEGEGPREDEIGLNETPPALNLSSIKSFTQKDVAEFIYDAVGESKNKIGHLRELAIGPMVSSSLFDMCAVSYYYSIYEIPNPPRHLLLVARSKNLYIYKNLNAWPYFYLAEQTVLEKRGAHLKDPLRGAAYLGTEDFFKLSPGADRSEIELVKFSFGKMDFKFKGKERGLLVIADAWHPFWKAKTINGGLKVIKANEIFKGVILPPGEYPFSLYFDTSPYKGGIYVSVISWVIFLAALLLIRRFKWNIRL